MSLESDLLTYGPLGAWTLMLIWERWTWQRKQESLLSQLIGAINNNTAVIQRLEAAVNQVRGRT